jgi:hypothetical protein
MKSLIDALTSLLRPDQVLELAMPGISPGYSLPIPMVLVSEKIDAKKEDRRRSHPVWRCHPKEAWARSFSAGIGLDQLRYSNTPYRRASKNSLIENIPQTKSKQTSKPSCYTFRDKENQ